MNCPSCGNLNLSNARFCDNCGKGLGMAMRQAVVPAGGPSVALYQGVGLKNNGMAIASMVLGIVAVLFGVIPVMWYVAIPAAVLALVFGYVGRGQIAAARGTQGGKGMTTAGIVMGWVAVGLIILWILLVVNVITSLGNYDY